MPDELYHQSRIVSDVCATGGWGKKWSSTYSVGVPDLILGWPGKGANFMEVKLFRGLKLKSNGDLGRFSRKIDLTTLQERTLKQMAEAGMSVMVGTVLDYTPRRRYLALTHWHTSKLSLDMLSCVPLIEMPYGKRIDFEVLFDEWDKYNTEGA